MARPGWSGSFLCGVLLGVALAGCGDDHAGEELELAKLYRTSGYSGTYSFDGTLLTLSVTDAAGLCFDFEGVTWIFRVVQLEELSMITVFQGGPEVPWTRPEGIAGDVVGTWTQQENGKVLDLKQDGTFTGAKDPDCFVDCAVVPAPTAAGRIGGLLLYLLPAAFIAVLKRRNAPSG